jgi:hypothetical protein
MFMTKFSYILYVAQRKLLLYEHLFLVKIGVLIRMNVVGLSFYMDYFKSKQAF